MQNLRSLLQAPAWTLTVVLTLALGIGSAAAIFSVVSNVLLRPLPYPNADELVSVWHDAPATFSIVAVLLIGVAAFASYVPARRAARVPPAEALSE